MQGTLLAAAISPDNTPHGYNLTFAFPMLLFIVVATLLYLRFRSPHRVPGHTSLSSSRWTSPAAREASPHSEAVAARPVAAGLDTGSPDDVPGPEGVGGDTTQGSTLQEGQAQESEGSE